MSAPQPANTSEEQQNNAYSDIMGCVSQYFYEGWRYRLPQEGNDKIRKESNEAAHRMVDGYMEREKAKLYAALEAEQRAYLIASESMGELDTEELAVPVSALRKVFNMKEDNNNG